MMPRTKRPNRTIELNLSVKIALATSAIQVIRAATVAELARADMHLCLVPGNPVKLQEVADKLREIASIDGPVVAPDLRDPAAPQQAVPQAVERLGGPDLLVNDAGA